MDYIKDLLKNLKKLEPIDTGVKAKYEPDREIKAVVFDIYGTLLVSSSGDVDQAEMNTKNLKEALEASGIAIAKNTDESLAHILYDFEYTIKVCHQSAKMNNVPYPEIDILSIWEIVLLHARRKNLISFNGEVDTMLMTCVFEFLSNKVYPMPGMKEVIAELQRRKIPLGIVSNAQFYTPVLMNYFLNNTFEVTDKIQGFDDELTVFSYKLGRGKPDPILFAELKPILCSKYVLSPSEVLFVGNDMLKDIYASKQVGFKTALFAGDKRSLRMRENDERTKLIRPDFIITELKQILEII